ncbi:MAG: amidohydrolase family protein [Vicinamibacterales bacterium]
MICDAHVHFFSPAFFGALAAQRGVATSDAIRHLAWDDPISPEALADRWAGEMDAQGVTRAAIIASVPGDEDSVAGAIARHPSRFVGYFMLDPTKDDAENRVVRALERGLRGVCLFPAMQRYSLHDERVGRIAEIVAGFGPASETGPLAIGGPAGAARGAVLFVHCGVLSVGARGKLGLPSPFDMSKGNPLDLHTLALRFPTLPIVIPHFGAGMFREALMLADVCPNVHFDTSSSNAWVKYTPGLTLEQVFETALAVVGPERLLFGTDSSFFPRGWHRAVYERQRNALANLGVSEAARAAIFGGNFERVLGGARPA